MADFFGIPSGRLPIAIAMVMVLAAVVSWLQGRFNSSDVKKGIAIAMAYKPTPASPTVFDALTAKKEGDPGCDGEVVSTLLGDIKVVCATPGQPGLQYQFRVLLDGKRPPKPANDAAQKLVDGLVAARQ